MTQQRRGSEEKGASEDVLSDVKGLALLACWFVKYQRKAAPGPEGSKCWLCDIKLVGRNIVLDTISCIFFVHQAIKTCLKSH